MTNKSKNKWPSFDLDVGVEVYVEFVAFYAHGVQGE